MVDLSHRLIFFDCFSKQAHLERPGRANPLDPSADQGSVDRQDHGRESWRFAARACRSTCSPSWCPRACVTGGEVWFSTVRGSAANKFGPICARIPDCGETPT